MFNKKRCILFASVADAESTLPLSSPQGAYYKYLRLAEGLLLLLLFFLL